MTHFDILNEDVLNIIINQLDTYDMLKLSIICNNHKNLILYKIKHDLENIHEILHECLNCNMMCMKIKTCSRNNDHVLCNNCLIKCDFCNNSTGTNLCCGSQTLKSFRLKSHNYGQSINCDDCGIQSCLDCIKQNFYTYNTCLKCYNKTII